MNCRFWHALGWMFLSTVLLFSAYSAYHLHCWSGLIIALVGAGIGYGYGRYKQYTRSTKYLYKKHCGKEFHLMNKE